MGLNIVQNHGFQSTRPIRGATTMRRTTPWPVWISIHAPHTGRDLRHLVKVGPLGISIHAPHTGRDTLVLGDEFSVQIFQSTRPIRGATTDLIKYIKYERISIHAPHTGRDYLIFWGPSLILSFQSTRPIRGATFCTPAGVAPAILISIHAPHTGRDVPSSA